MNTQNLAKKLDQIQQDIGTLDNLLQDLYKEGSFEEYCANLQPLELAKLEATLAFAAANLCATFYRLSPSVQAELTDDHPIFLMLTRVKSYLGKINKQQRTETNTKQEVGSNEMQKSAENLVQTTLNSIFTVESA